MKKTTLIPMLVVSLVVATSCSHRTGEGNNTGDAYGEHEIPVAHVPTQEEMVERGKYLVTTSACHDCHTPKIFTETGPELDQSRLLSGHPQADPIPKIEKGALANGWVLFAGDLTAFVGPWGVSFAANLTPDDTGIGAWTFENFKTAIQKGKFKGHEGGRDLLPPMPWQVYSNFKEDDLRAIFAYLKSLPKVNNLVPANIPPSDIQ